MRRFEKAFAFLKKGFDSFERFLQYRKFHFLELAAKITQVILL